ncbi:MAG TPA: glycerophosphoryl diester phosphodiesterase membrane domain-containing protein [Steroidobacteraceae bacterium]
MANILYPPARPLSVGEVLDLAFRMFGATLVKCLPYSFAAVIIGQLPNLRDLLHGQNALLMQPDAQIRRLHDPSWLFMELVAGCGIVLLYSAVILRAYALVTGHPVASGVELTSSLRRFPGMLLIWILVVLGMVACLAPAALFLLAGSGFAGTAMAVVAGVVLLIPASWLALRWSCSGTVYLLTDRGAVASMAHSWHLTEGSFWRLSLIYTVGIVVIVVLSGITGMLSGMLAAIFARGDIVFMMGVITAVAVLLGAISTPFYVALALAVLGDLSVRKEGSDLAERISSPATP